LLAEPSRPPAQRAAGRARRQGLGAGSLAGPPCVAIGATAVAVAVAVATATATATATAGAPVAATAVPASFLLGGRQEAA